MLSQEELDHREQQMRLRSSLIHCGNHIPNRPTIRASNTVCRLHAHDHAPAHTAAAITATIPTSQLQRPLAPSCWPPANNTYRCCLHPPPMVLTTKRTLGKGMG